MMREIKLVLLGEAGVGKSSLVLRFVSDRFDTLASSTIGASFMSKTFSYDGETFKYQIWDTAGQEKYKALAPMYYRGSHAALVVYDLTSEQSFNSLKRWVKELQQYGPPNIIIAIAGNKCDLTDAREVETETGQEYAESIDAMFAEVSALTSENVAEIFEGISKRLPDGHGSGYRGFQVQGGRDAGVEEKKCCE